MFLYSVLCISNIVQFSIDMLSLHILSASTLVIYHYAVGYTRSMALFESHTYLCLDTP
jgi:hypothetical protein